MASKRVVVIEGDDATPEAVRPTLGLLERLALDSDWLRSPSATILAAAMILEYPGFADAAQRLSTAVERVYAAGSTLTPDQGSTATTQAFYDAVAQHL